MSEAPKPILPGEFDVDLQYQMGEPIKEEGKIELSPKLDESFKINQEFLDFFSRLVDEELAVGNKDVSTMLVSIKFFGLESAKSTADVKKVLNQALEKKLINEKNYKLLLELLDEDESDQSVTTTDSAPEKAPELEKSLEQLQEELNNARSSYVERLVTWRNENRKNKTIFSGLMSGLGVEKQMPQRIEPKDLQDLEEDYIRAKKNLFTFLLKNLSKETTRTATERVLEVIENEKKLLKNEIEKSWTELEKGILDKAEKKV